MKTTTPHQILLNQDIVRQINLDQGFVMGLFTPQEYLELVTHPEESITVVLKRLRAQGNPEPRKKA